MAELDVKAYELSGETGIRDRTEVIRIYPNPASDYLVVSSDSEFTEVLITHLDGRQSLLETSSGQFQASIDVSSLDSGSYIIHVNFGSRNLYQSLFIKK